MPDIIFDIPKRKENIKLNISLDYETYKKIKVIQYRNEISMAQTVEMLIRASLPEYYRQFPILEAEETEMFMLSEGVKQRLCQNPSCPTPFSQHQLKNMVKWQDKVFCSEGCATFFRVNQYKKVAVQKGTACQKCGKEIPSEGIQKTIEGEKYILCSEKCAQLFELETIDEAEE